MNKGFTLVELIIVISIIGILSMIGVGSYAQILQRSRDMKRISDMRDLNTALVQYKVDNGTFPNETIMNGQSIAGWEVSTQTNFLSTLADYMNRSLEDPLNIALSPIDMFASRPDGNFFYMYHFYNSSTRGGEYYGCDFTGPFAVVGFKSVEAISTDNLPKAQCGPMPCTGGGTPNVCRDWSNEFDYSVILRP